MLFLDLRHTSLPSLSMPPPHKCGRCEKGQVHYYLPSYQQNKRVSLLHCKLVECRISRWSITRCGRRMSFLELCDTSLPSLSVPPPHKCGRCEKGQVHYCLPFAPENKRESLLRWKLVDCQISCRLSWIPNVSHCLCSDPPCRTVGLLLELS